MVCHLKLEVKETFYITTTCPVAVSNAGPMTITTDPNVHINAINNLNAHGGGDCPELAMTGLILALQNT